MIELERVSVTLGGARVVHAVSAGVEQGAWVTLLGPNGAGKSTLLRAIAGLVRAEGSIRIGGTPLRALDRRALARRVAVVPQLPQLPRALTVEEYVLLGRTPYLSYLGRENVHDRGSARRALERLDLVRMARRPLGSLSGGERQRAVLARALAQEASVLLLDEPTTALDPGRQQDVLELVDALRLESGLTVLSAMHDLTLAGQYAQRLVLLDGGRVVAAGTPDEVLTVELVAEHYGAAVRIVDGAVVPVRRG
ncbi:MAG TPA: ABC transporter ATP-binding protein [Gaiellaceae bacterium]|nr:ABC transporter ATP-binding protein [Gaiellaceae bacterium]